MKRLLIWIGGTDAKSGIAVALAVVFVLACIVAMVTPLPFKEPAAWVCVALLSAWLGLGVVGKGVERVTDYNYAAIKQGTVVPPGTVPATPAPSHAPAETRPESHPEAHAEPAPLPTRDQGEGP